MSSLKNNVILELLFADNSTRTYVFEDVPSENISSVKANIFAINANADNEYENFYKTFVSKDGEAVTKISACKIVSIEEEVIYDG